MNLLKPFQHFCEMNNSLKIGLTGGIASGKSIVAELFSNLGVSVIDADKISHYLTTKNKPAFEEILEHFGKGILGNDGELDRKRLRAIVFNNKTLKNDLEHIIHPKVSEAINKEVRESYDPYVIIMVPLLIETGYNKFVNRILVVDCALDTQIKRLINRDQETHESAKRIIGHQIKQKNRIKIAHDVIDNDMNTTIKDLENRVRKLHQFYLELSGK
jgi:dephospho-CoA kinase